MAEPKTVEFKPYKKNGENLVSVGTGISETSYHQSRNAILDMRERAPALGKELDAYLSAEAKNPGNMSGGGFNDERISKLRTELTKRGLGLDRTTLDVAGDLKSHGYSSSHRPHVMIEVNGRPMHPSLVANSLGASSPIDLPRSDAPGKVSGSFKVNNFGDLAKQVEEGNKYGVSRHGGLAIAREVAHHAGRLGAVVGVGLSIASGAQAAEVGQEAINAVAPGLGTLALGEGPTKGKLCSAFGQAGGALSGVGAGMAGLALGGPVTGIAAGIGTEAIATPVLTDLCEKIADGPLVNAPTMSYATMSGAAIGNRPPPSPVRAPGMGG